MRWLPLSLLLYLIGSVPVLAANEVAFFTVDIKLEGTGLEALDVNIDCDFNTPFSLDFRIPIDDSRTFHFFSDSPGIH